MTEALKKLAIIEQRHDSDAKGYEAGDKTDQFTESSILDQSWEYNIHKHRGWLLRIVRALMHEVRRLKKEVRRLKSEARKSKSVDGYKVGEIHE